MSAPSSGSGPARHAIVRWAWRVFRREWRQQVLILALLSLAVAATVGMSTAIVQATSGGGKSRGDAAGVVQIDATDPALADATLAAVKARFGTVEVVRHSPVPVPGVAAPLDVRGQDPHGTYGHALLALRHGRYPTGAHEVALTKGAATLLDAHVGGTVTLDRVRRAVVGIVEDPRDLHDDFALVAPDQPATAWTVLLGHVDPPGGGGGRRGAAASPGTSATAGTGTPTSTPSFGVEVTGSDGPAVRTFVLVVAALGMSLVGLVAAAAFVVVAQRRQRQLGLLAAIGADDRHVRLVMLANGAIIGLASALLGTVLGVVGWVLGAPYVEQGVGRRLGRFDLPWGMVATAAALAVLTAIAAAWWPARAAARQPVMSALSRRPTAPLPARRASALAAVLLVGGVVAIYAARATHEHPNPSLIIGGTLGVIVGTVLATPAAIRSLGRPAGRLPFAPRLALRDLVRHQARASAALGAITLSLAIAVAVAVIAQASVPEASKGNLSSHQLVVGFGPVQESGPAAAQAAAGAPAHPTVTAAQPTVDRIHQLIGASAAVLPLSMVVTSSPPPGQPVPPIEVDLPVDHGSEFVSNAVAATPEILRHYGIDPASIDPSVDLLTSLPGPIGLLDVADLAARGVEPTKVQRVALPSWSDAPSALVTEGAMARHRWLAVPTGWLIDAGHRISSTELAAARHLAASSGLTVTGRSSSSGAATAAAGATGVGALLALAIVAMTLGLLRGEAAAEVRTLTAVGASSHTRRTITASAAGALALAGAVLAIAGTYAAVLAGYRSDLHQLASPPVLDLLGLVIGLPLVAAAAGWLLAGRDADLGTRTAV